MDLRQLRRFYHDARLALRTRWLGVSHPLPRFTDYSIAPDFANRMIAEVLRGKPKLIVEAGSGISTILIGYCLRKVGGGRLISLEHEEKYLQACRDEILRHQLQAHVDLVHAPLKPYQINGRDWLWYEDAFLQRVRSIDLLIVDGPPADVQPLSRYPALPLLWRLLDEHVVILMDDGARPDEQEIVDRWMRERSGLAKRYVATERGLIRLERR